MGPRDPRRRAGPRQVRLGWLAVAVPLVLALLVPCPAFGQAPFEDLPLRIDLGDQLRVEDQAGARVSGRLTSLTPAELAIQTNEGERRLPRDEVREVRVRRYPLKRSALVGAAVFAALGTVAMCSHDEEHCALIGPLAAAPIGVGVGLAFGALIPRSTPVYQAPAGSAPVPARTGGGFLSDLALRANLDDEVYVEELSGVRVAGRLTRITPDTLTVRTGPGEREFARAAVREVVVRRPPRRASILIGAGVGAVAGAVAACTGSDREECVDGPILAGALGAGVGLAVGSLVRVTKVAYPPRAGRVVVVPVLSHDAIGVRVARLW